MNDNAKFKIGDVVMLNSESPHMTVTDITPAGLCFVSWFNSSGAHAMHEFREPCLCLVMRRGDS